MQLAAEVSQDEAVKVTKVINHLTVRELSRAGRTHSFVFQAYSKLEANSNGQS
jgi:hypothetical protein